jgi:hypothetical protein
MYLVLSAFTSSPISLLSTNKSSAFSFIVCFVTVLNIPHAFKCLTLLSLISIRVSDVTPQSVGDGREVLCGSANGQNSGCDVSNRETEWRRPLCVLLTNYLERGSELLVITSRLFVSLDD